MVKKNQETKGAVTCPRCGAKAKDLGGKMYVCPKCNHEWTG